MPFLELFLNIYLHFNLNIQCSKLKTRHAATMGLKLGIHSQAYIIYLKAMASDLIFKLKQLN